MIHKKAIGKRKDTILFVHGAWHGAWCWDVYFMDYFAQAGYECYALNLTKHDKPGDTKGINGITIKHYIKDVRDAVDSINHSPVIVGHSMGGLVVQKFLKTHSCKKAVLLASVPYYGVKHATWRIVKRKSRYIPYLLGYLFHVVNTPEKARWAFFSDDMPEDHVEMYCKKLCGESFLAFFGMLWPKIRRIDAQKIPLLVMGGEKDKIFNENDIKQTAEFHGVAPAKILSDTAHDMMLDTNWQKAADHIITWLEK